MADEATLGQRFAALNARIDGLLGPSHPTEKPPSLQDELDAFGAALAKAREAEAHTVEKPSTIIEGVRKSIGKWLPWLHPRAPKGSPDGGKFQPKSGFDGPKAGVAWSPKTSLFEGTEPGKTFDVDAFMAQHKPGAPKPRPAGAVQHPHTDNHGKPVWVDYPSRASPSEGWNNPNGTATFIPGSIAPEKLNGVSMALAYTPPRTAEEWTNVPGQNPELEAMLPPLVAPKGQHVGAGVIIEEPDGRVWIVSPTNGYGGYRQTFPKGTYEDDVASLQANAIKEAYEESGLQVEITGVLGDFKRTTSVARFYTARRVGGSPANMGWESQAVRLSPVSHLRKWLNKGYVDHPIVDAYEALRGDKVGKAFDESKHERWPKGSPLGGQFKSTGSTGMTQPPKIGWKKDGSGPGANATYFNKMQAAYRAAQAGDYGPAQKLLDDNAKFWQAHTKGQPMNSHGKWKAQMAQYADSLLAAKESMDGVKTSASVVEGKLGAQKISLWKKVGEKPGGTAPGGLYTDELGQKWLVKGNLQGKDDARARNEVLAAKLMEAAGIPAPTYKLVDLGNEYGGGLGVATKWEPGLVKINTSMAKKVAQQQFAVHAWLGNWDVVGATGDNLLVKQATGDVINIDPGGALLYRAQGKPKTGMEFAPSASDWESMRDPAKNASAAALFGPMTESDLKFSAKKLQGMTDEKIDALVDAHWVDTDMKSKKALASDLKARRDIILMKAGVIDKNLKPTEPKATAPKPAALNLVEQADSPKKITPSADFKGPIEPPQGLNSGATGTAFKALTGSPLFMGEPSDDAAKSLKMLSTTWKQHAIMATEPSAKFAALQMAGYTAALQHFHETGDPLDHKVFMGEISADVYKTADDYIDAIDKFEEKAPEKTLEELDAIAAAHTAQITGKKPKGSGAATMADMNPKITDMKSVQTYKEIAFSVAEAGGIPLPPKIDGLKGDISLFQKWQGDWSLVSPAMKKEMADGAIYSGIAGVNAAALSAYGQAIALQHGMDVPGADLVKPGAPDWDSYKTTSAANPGHNKKVDKIKAMFEAGDATGLAAMTFGTNTYGKKQAKLANEALAALGSRNTVAPGTSAPAATPIETDIDKPFDGDTSWVKLGKGEKVVDAGSEFGVKWAKIEVQPKGFNPKEVPPPPDFFKNGTQGATGTWKSSIEAINTSNNATVNEVYAAATKKGATTENIEAMSVHKIDKVTGKPTGEMVSVKAHPAQAVKDYHAEVVAELKAQVEPTFKTVQAGEFSASYSAIAEKMAKKAKALTPGQLAAHTAKAADYAILDASAAAKLPVPKEGMFKDTGPGKPGFDSFREKSKAALNANPELASLIGSYTGSSYDAWNSAMRSGKATGSAKKLQDGFAKAAVELPEGTILHRGIGVGESTYKSILGAIIQDGSLQSASYGSKAAFGGKPTQLRLHITKGVKGLDVTSKSNFGTSESEIILAPNVRYAVMKVTPGAGAKSYVDILVLPH